MSKCLMESTPTQEWGMIFVNPSKVSHTNDVIVNLYSINDKHYVWVHMLLGCLQILCEQMKPLLSVEIVLVPKKSELAPGSCQWC